MPVSSALGGLGDVADVLKTGERRKIRQDEVRLVTRVAKQITKIAKGLTFTNVSLAQLSPEAVALVESAFKGLEGKEICDYHTHILGSGACCDTGCFCPEADTVVKASFMAILKANSGVTSAETADGDFVSQLLRLQYRQKHVLLAFDAHYNEEGQIDMAKTGMYTPNEYIWKLAQQHPDNFIPSCSIHPYRLDALAQLEKAHANGARLIKWLPNAMGIDPSSDKCQAYYDKCHELGMVILSHCGEEKAVSSDRKFQEMGNPLLFRRALDSGVKVIVAHCASLGRLPDWDSAETPQPRRPCFELFLRMARVAKWKNLLFGDISAITLINRYKTFIPLLAASDIHENLINGTDYPLVCVSLMNRTKPFINCGLIDRAQYKLLKEIYRINPTIWDFVVKRIMRGPNGERFPDSVFLRNPRLGI